MTPFESPCLSGRTIRCTHRDQFRLHERVVHVSGREEDDSESDEDVFVCIIESVGIVPVESVTDRSFHMIYLDRNSIYSATFSKRYSGSMRKS